MKEEIITKYRKALWKLDHTICLNNLEGNLKFNIDSPEDYISDGGYDPDDTDCKDIREAIECLEELEEALNLLDYLFDCAKYQTHPDPFFYEDMPERIYIDVRRLENTEYDHRDYTENNKRFDLAKSYFIESGHKLKEDL